VLKKFCLLCDAEGKKIDVMRLHCKLCLDDQRKLGDRGHNSLVTNFSSTTSTFNMNQHLSSKHNISIARDKNMAKKVLEKNSPNENNQAATSSYELARDLFLGFCRDIMSFKTVSKAGLTDFFPKNMSNVMR
jgi:hypothetical protein